MAGATTILLNPFSLAANAIGRAPGTACSEPSSPSSAAKTVSAAAMMPICSRAINMETAIARSKPEPAFGRSAGERFTVTRLLSEGMAQEENAARTLSFASLRDASGSPTRVVPTSPGPTWVCTSTIFPFSPCSATAYVRARVVEFIGRHPEAMQKPALSPGQRAHL